MELEFYKHLYLSGALKKKKRSVIRKLKHHVFSPKLYLLVLSQREQKQFEFFSTNLLKQHFFKDTSFFIVGVAESYDQAMYLVEEITQEVYTKTKACNLREYILNNQSKSGEGSVGNP